MFLCSLQQKTHDVLAHETVNKTKKRNITTLNEQFQKQHYYMNCYLEQSYMKMNTFLHFTIIRASGAYGQLDKWVYILRWIKNDSSYLHYFDIARVSTVIGDSYRHYLDPMSSQRWEKDIAYAMTPFKLLTWVNGVWPLQNYNTFSLIRCIFATFCMVRTPSVGLWRSVQECRERSSFRINIVTP